MMRVDHLLLPCTVLVLIASAPTLAQAPSPSISADADAAHAARQPSNVAHQSRMASAARSSRDEWVAEGWAKVESVADDAGQSMKRAAASLGQPDEMGWQDLPPKDAQSGRQDATALLARPESDRPERDGQRLQDLDLDGLQAEEATGPAADSAPLVVQEEVVAVRPEVIEYGDDGSLDARGVGDNADAPVTITAPTTSLRGDALSLSPADRKVDMFAGEVKVFGSVDVTRVAIGNGDIIRAEILSTGELLVIAQAAGSTSMRLWNTDATQTGYNIRVSENDPVTRVRMERMVRLRVRLVEFRKSALGELGIDWGKSAAGPTFAAAGDAVGSNLFRPASDGFDALPNRVAPFSTYFGIASNITSRINFLASNGDAMTLAEPVLSAVNGGVASFLAGGEVPYPTVGANGEPIVDFKEYGIKLDVRPLIDDRGNVRASVATEISQIDDAVSVGGAPGLLTRRAETEVNVLSGETIVISGLLSAENSESTSRVPGLGRVPLLGSLFRTKDSRESVTELVIFVTPEVIEPAGAVARGRDLQTYERASADLASATDRLDADRPSFME